MTDSIRFRLNGREVQVDGVNPHTTLLALLRDLGFTGTKEGCAEGECGACAVALLENDDSEAGGSRLVAVNSCLLLACAVDGREFFSVEGIKDSAGGRAASPAKSSDLEPLHPVQTAMVEQGGSQCGYCTPGFVVSLFCEYHRKGRTDFDPESIAGNLCRCTGYRPILDAGRSLPVVQPGDRVKQRLAEPAPEVRPLSYRRDDVRFERPTNLADALRYLSESPELTPIAGGTDLTVELNQRHRRDAGFLCLDSVPELKSLVTEGDELIFGGGIPLGDIERRSNGLVPLLDELWPLFSSGLIRARATLGGNLATASPIGDSPPALLALDATLTLASRDGQRSVPIAEFFQGYRQTALKPGELIVDVRIRKPLPDFTRFLKVSKRVHDDISTVAAGFSVRLDRGKISAARLAYGGVAATPVRATRAEQALIGKSFDSGLLGGAGADVMTLLDQAFSPMSDHRGSAVYRRQMVTGLFRRFVYEATSEVAA